MDSVTYLSEEGSVELKEAIDLQELRDKGTEFEVDISNVQQETDTTNQYFPGEEVYKNLLMVDDETAEICDREGLEKFEVLIKKMEDITENKDGGVYKRLVKPGSGPVVPQGALVRVHYNAYHELEDEPFDSTRLRREILKFRLGCDGSVPGMHVAVSTMKKGEKSRFIFRPEYYYGELGCAPRIPPNCTVLFDIELESFVEREGVDDYEQMTEDEKRRAPFSLIMKISKSEREEGNQFYNTGMYSRALNKYKQAARVLENCHLKSDEEESEQQKLLVRVFLNIALCCLKLKQNGLAITYCHRVLAIQPNNVKALFRKGQALHSMSEFTEAKAMYKRAEAQESGNRDIREALIKLEQDMKRFRVQTEDYRQMCQRMVALSSSGDSGTETVPGKDDTDGADSAGECSERFRSTVKQKLEEFRQESYITEMPFPEGSLTPAEIACILEEADKLGMKVQRRGTGNASQMVVLKTKKQLNL